MVNTERPKANATPSSPMPTCGNAAASTALPQPPKTSQSVPRNSAVIFCVKLNSLMIHLFRICSPAGPANDQTELVNSSQSYIIRPASQSGEIGISLSEILYEMKAGDLDLQPAEQAKA